MMEKSCVEVHQRTSIRLMKEMRANKEKDATKNNDGEVLHLEIQYLKHHLRASEDEVAEREGERMRERNIF